MALAVVVAPASVVRAGTAVAIDRIGPSTVSVGDPDFTIRVSGENFDRGSVVLLDGTPLQTAFLSKQRLHALVPQSATSSAGARTITVRTGAGVTTAPATLTVGAKDPDVTVDRTNPDTLPVFLSGFSLTIRVSGEGFTEVRVLNQTCNAGVKMIEYDYRPGRKDRLL